MLVARRGCLFFLFSLIDPIFRARDRFPNRSTKHPFHSTDHECKFNASQLRGGEERGGRGTMLFEALGRPIVERDVASRHRISALANSIPNLARPICTSFRSPPSSNSNASDLNGTRLIDRASDQGERLNRKKLYNYNKRGKRLTVFLEGGGRR